MGTVIAFANQKGGVAKTTSTYNVGTALARAGKKTLMIDLDGQASLTISAGLEPYDFDHTIVSVLQKDAEPLEQCIQHLQQDNLDLVTSRLELAQLEVVLIGRPVRETILRRAIETVSSRYDFILIDCPPQLSILTINALASADQVLIPVKTDYLAYRGLEQLLDTVAEIRELVNPQLSILGVIATMYEMRVKDDQEILRLLQDKYHVIAVVKKLAIVKKGVYDGKAVMEQAPNNDAAAEYQKVAECIMEKGGI